MEEAANSAASFFRLWQEYGSAGDREMEKETAIFMIHNGWTPRPREIVPPENDPWKVLQNMGHDVEAIAVPFGGLSCRVWLDGELQATIGW